MMLNGQIEAVLQPDEKLLAELKGELDLPAINDAQCNGRLFATNERLIFAYDIGDQARHDSFYYDSIERIVVRKSFKNEPRVLFEADDEIQMLRNITNTEDIDSFLNIVQEYVD